jgi:hypothetical protein
MFILNTILSKRRFLFTAIFSFFVYIVIYLSATQHLIFTDSIDGAKSFFSFDILPNWQDLIFRQRSTFLFEPIGVAYLSPNIKLFLSVPNIIIGAFLSLLVSLNVAVSYYSFRSLSLGGFHGVTSLLGTIPAIVSGTACCVPTLILVIGLQLTATLATIWVLFVPISILLLFLSLWWSLYRIKTKKF